MTKNRIQWSEEEEMMAKAYENMALSFSQIESYMKNHIRTVKNGMGIINDGDIEEVLAKLSDMINKNLHNVSQKRISITTGEIVPQSTVSPETSPQQSSGWNSTSSNGVKPQFESNAHKNKKKNAIKLDEQRLRLIIRESLIRSLYS